MKDFENANLLTMYENVSNNVVSILDSRDSLGHRDFVLLKRDALS